MNVYLRDRAQRDATGVCTPKSDQYQGIAVLQLAGRYFGSTLLVEG